MDMTKSSKQVQIPPYTNALNQAAKMQRYIRESQQSIEQNTSSRDHAIYSAYGAGKSIREIGRAIGISHTQVKNIVDRFVTEGTGPHPDMALADFDEELGGDGPNLSQLTVNQ